METPTFTPEPSIRPVSGPLHETAKQQRSMQWWGPLLGILIVVGLYIVPEFIAMPLSYAVFSAVGHSGNYDAFLTWTSTVTGNVTYTSITDGLVLVVVAIVAYMKRGTLTALGIGRYRLIYLLQVVAIFVAYLVFYLIVVVGATVLIPGFDAEQQRDIGFNDPAGYRELLGTFVVLVIVTPIVEEIMFRGFLFRGFRKKLPLWPAAIITSLIFGAAHLSSLGSNSPVWVAALDTFVLSMILCVMRERLKTLWPMIGVHGLKNTLAFVFLYLVH